MDSKTITVLRFPLAVAVVYLHSYGRDFDITSIAETSLSGLAIYEYIRYIISKILTHCAVPTFFFISGYLFFLNSNSFGKKEYFIKLQKRFCSLFVPYVLWITLFMLYKALPLFVNCVTGVGSLSDVVDYMYGIGGIDCYLACKEISSSKDIFGNNMVCTAPFLVPMWFIRDLMVVVVFSPIIYRAVKKLNWIVPVTLLFFTILPVSCSIDNNLKATFAFFTIGAIFAINKLEFTTLLYKFKYVFLVLFPVLFLSYLYVLIYYNSSLVKELLWGLLLFDIVACVIIIALSVSENSLVMKYSKKLSPATFFIFAFHVFIIGYSEKITSILFTVGEAKLWVVLLMRYFTSPILCVVLCLFMYTIIDKFSAPISNVLNGRIHYFNIRK